MFGIVEIKKDYN